MENVIVVYSDSSSDSIKEIEPPKKLPPPLIDIEVDEIFLNVKKNTTQSLIKTIISEEIPQESPGDHPNHWTDDMKKFYNDDWGDEDSFTVENIQANMDKHPYLWQVSQRDLIARSKKRNSYLKCLNCCQFGHTMYRCKEPLHIPKCHMCGQAGHLDKRCPNSICLNCGNQMVSYVKRCNKCSSESLAECVRCSLPGHHFINCSDNWRRFHSTIGKIETDPPEKTIYKSASELWCCNCGKRGHYEINCRLEKPPGFPETSPFVASYDNVFNTQSGSQPIPAPQFVHMNQVSRRRKGSNCIRGNNQRYQHINDKSLFKLHKVKKRKKKKKKKEKDKDWKRLYQTPDFIPI